MLGLWAPSSVIPAIGRLKQKDCCEFKICLWAIWQTISKQTKKCGWRFGASVPAPQDTPVWDTCPNRLLLHLLLGLFCQPCFHCPLIGDLLVELEHQCDQVRDPRRASLKMPCSFLPWGCLNDISDVPPRARVRKYRRLVPGADWSGFPQKNLRNEGECSPPTAKTLTVKNGDTRQPGEEAPVRPDPNLP